MKSNIEHFSLTKVGFLKCSSDYTVDFVKFYWIVKNVDLSTRIPIVSQQILFGEKWSIFQYSLLVAFTHCL